MPKKQTNNTLSKEPDPYSFEHYPEKFAVKVGQQTHNARQLLRAAAHKRGKLLDMYRQPIPNNTVDEIYRKTGHIYHDGRWHRRRTMTRARREAARELRRRQGLPVRGTSPAYIASNAHHVYSRDELVGEILMLLKEARWDDQFTQNLNYNTLERIVPPDVLNRMIHVLEVGENTMSNMEYNSAFERAFDHIESFIDHAR